MPIRASNIAPIPGIDNPLPDPATEKVATIAKPGDESALPPLVRPRSLSTEATRLIRELGEKFNTAAPLEVPEKTPGKVAEIDPRSTGAVVKGGRHAGK